jgi:hypothetical protein
MWVGLGVLGIGIVVVIVLVAGSGSRRKYDQEPAARTSSGPTYAPPAAEEPRAGAGGYAGAGSVGSSGEPTPSGPSASELERQRLEAERQRLLEEEERLRQSREEQVRREQDEAARAAAAAASSASGASDVESAYRAVIDAYNRCDGDAFFRGFQDPLDCFHNRGSVSVASLRSGPLGQQMAGCGYRLRIDSLRVAAPGSSRAVLYDDGVLIWPDGHSRGYNKAVRMVRDPSGRWVVAAWVDPTAHRCWADAFSY